MLVCGSAPAAVDADCNPLQPASIATSAAVHDRRPNAKVAAVKARRLDILRTPEVTKT